ncbi:MAG: phenylalanine--tRNA ligase subunit beta [Rhizobacter sp.]|nr:phenylalanine--tRNA ligase subunit beta [Chlorobiales bacterium]
MKISLNWLKEFLPNLPWGFETVITRLTELGIEVEGTQHLGSNFTKVVVGRVLAVEKHPNADKLSICKVDVGTAAEGSLQIVCGAPNVAAGQTVAVALVGATLSMKSGETLTIKKSKIRGTESQGMICAEDELGLSDNHDGIMILDDALPPGEPLEKFIPRDTVLEISITPNRPDVLSHLGVARELAAAGNSNLVLPNAPPISFASQSQRIGIKDTEGCPCYTAVVIEGVRIEASPAWLQQKLKAVGLRPINNVADITNYVLHTIGRPLHAFDINKLSGEKIIVRSDVNEKFTTLDGKERQIKDGMVMICDAEKPVAIGGVMGGLDSQITAQTTRVLLESAIFDPASIRKASKTLGLSTDASYRFERGVDADAVQFGAELAAKLIIEIAGGVITEAAIVRPKPFTPKQVTLRPAKATALLGQDIAVEKMISILESIGFGVAARSDQQITFTVPSYRVDVDAEVDLIEEIIRVYGYNNISIAQKLASKYGDQKDSELLSIETIREASIGFGFKELLTNSMMPKAQADFFSEKVVETLNPLSEEMQAMRPRLLPSLLKVVAHNLNHGNRDLRLFEVGSVFEADAEGTYFSGYREREMLGLVITGNRFPESWGFKSEATDFFDLKGVVEMLLQKLGLLEKLRFIVYNQNALRLEIAAGVNADANLQPIGQPNMQPAGELMIVSADVLRAFGIEQKVFAAELDLTAIRAIIAQLDSRRQYLKPAKVPAVRRDLAFLVAKSVRSVDLVSEISATDSLIESVEIFDVYEGQQDAERRSLAFALKLQSYGQTLTDAEIAAVMAKVAARIGSKFGAELRQA